MESANGLAKCVNFVKKHRTIFIAGIIVIILALAVFMLLSYLKNARLSLFVAPSDAVITVNGEVYENDGTYRFYPGTVKIEVKKDGFRTRTDEVELSANRITEYNVYLVPEDGDMSVYLRDRNQYEKLRKLYNYDTYRSNDEAINDLFEKQGQVATISEKLPLIIRDARVSGVKDPYYIMIRDNTSSQECIQAACLLVYMEKKDKQTWGYEDPENAESELREQALAAIEKLGYNPDDYAIKWTRESGDY